MWLIKVLISKILRTYGIRTSVVYTPRLLVNGLAWIENVQNENVCSILYINAFGVKWRLMVSPLKPQHIPQNSWSIKWLSVPFHSTTVLVPYLVNTS